jgi:hypothetical protein
MKKRKTGGTSQRKLHDESIHTTSEEDEES